MKYFLHFLFWILIFFEGGIQLVGLPSFIYKPLYPAISIFLFFIVVFEKFEKIKLPAIKQVLLLIPLIVISGMVNGISNYKVIYFTVFLLYPILYFYALINDGLLSIERIKKLVVILILLQIPAILIKASILGISEGGAIGTMSTGEGSLSTIFPLVIISFLLPAYYYSNKKWYLVLVGCYTLFGIIGNKRALYLLVPLLIVFSIISYAYNNSLKVNTKLLHTWGYSFLASIILVYGIVVLNPTLNPENKVGGSFDPYYVYEYTMDYTSSETKNLKEIRRSAGLVYFTNYVISNFKTSLVGDGAGKLVQSSYSSNSGTIQDHYGVRYGGRMGIVWIVLQIGIIGLIIYLSIHFKLYRTIKKRVKLSNQKILYLGYINMLFVFLFDFLFYSQIVIKNDVIYSLYFFVLALLYKNYNK